MKSVDGGIAYIHVEMLILCGEPLKIPQITHEQTDRTYVHIRHWIDKNQTRRFVRKKCSYQSEGETKEEERRKKCL